MREEGSGRYRSRHDRAGLVGLVRDVLEQVAEEERAALSQARFDKLSSELGIEAPSARAICQRLELSWSEVKAWAQDRPRRVDKALAKRDGLAASDFGDGLAGQDFDQKDVVWALRLVASRRGSDQGPLIHEYEAEREAIEVADQRRWDHGGDLVLPSAWQLREIAGSWDRALLLAGLEPRPGREATTSGLDRIDAIEECYQATGALPRAKELEIWCQAQGVALADPRLPHAEALSEARSRMSRRGLEPPADAPPIDQRPDYSQSPSERRGKDRRRKELPPNYKQRWSDEELIGVLIAFLEQLPAGTKPTTTRYSGWARDHPRRPTVSTMSRGERPGFAWYREEARRQSREG